jgi:hypothetical protein
MRRVEWKGWDHGATVGVVAIRIYTAHGEEGPARRVPRLWRDAICARLKEINLVFRAAGNRSRQDHEELQDDSTGDKNEGYSPKNRSLKLSSVFVMIVAWEESTHGHPLLNSSGGDCAEGESRITRRETIERLKRIK